MGNDGCFCLCDSSSKCRRWVVYKGDPGYGCNAMSWGRGCSGKGLQSSAPCGTKEPRRVKTGTHLKVCSA